MSLKNILVVGCQHSGTRWVFHNVTLHPEIEAHHSSVPSGHSCYVPQTLASLEENKYHGVVFVYRDSTVVRRSNKKAPPYNFWDKLVESHQKEPNNPTFHIYSKDIVKNWVKISKIYMDKCEEKNIPFAIVSYEAMVQSRVGVLRKIFQDLGCDKNIYKYYNKNHTSLDKILGWGTGGTLECLDGNIKYFQN